jgi:hypothetical protein
MSLERAGDRTRLTRSVDRGRRPADGIVFRGV